MEWQQTGLKPPKVVTHATGEYLDSQDRVAMWIEAACDVKPGAEELLITKARKAYNEWATLHNVEPINREQFKARMSRLGYVAKEIRAGIVLPGLVLSPFDSSGPF